MNGLIGQLGKPEEIFGSPINEDIARFVEAGNIWHGIISTCDNGLVSVDIGGYKLQAVCDLPLGNKVTAYLHYEDVTISLLSEQPVPSTARNRLRCKIVKTFPLASQLKVTMDCGFMLTSVITWRSWEEMGLETGQEVEASFKASSLHLIPRL
jgi:tungstate transport system ATP-binding protein